jgi:cullin 1
LFNFDIQSNLFCYRKKVKINLDVRLKSVEERDIEYLHQTIDEDRKMVISSAIVRIMKTRQTLKHAFLIEEVSQQLSSRFKPKISVIKVNLLLIVSKI